MLTDAHLHITDAPEGVYRDFSELGLCFSCTAKRDEWKVQASSGTPNMRRFYGIHPWYADEWNPDTEAELVRLLESDPAAGVGEIGMDSKHGDLDLQAKVFSDQLDIASRMGRPVTVHMVGCENEVLGTLRVHAGGVPVILHSFKSESYVKPFAQAGCFFSVGPRLLSKSRENVYRIVSSVPEDRLLVESDAPNFPDSFSGMRSMVSEYASIMGKPVNWLLSVTEENLRRIA